MKDSLCGELRSRNGEKVSSCSDIKLEGQSGPDSEELQLVRTGLHSQRVTGLGLWSRPSWDGLLSHLGEGTTQRMLVVGGGG